MSDQQGPPKASLLNQPVEILLQVIGRLDQRAQIHLAIANPEIFIGPRLNIFMIDAENHVRRKRPTDPSTPLPQASFGMLIPLLNVAIEMDMDISVIETIVKAYKRVCPTSIDGIWGEGLEHFHPPLCVAAEFGRPRVVEFLLNEGANPAIKFSCQVYADHPSFNCSLVNYIHTDCQPLEGIHPDQTECATPIDWAASNAIIASLADRRVNHHNFEECAMILHNRGPRLQYKRDDGNMDIEPQLQAALWFPINAWFTGIVRSILDPIAPARRGDPQFQRILHKSLRQAWKCQFDDEQQDLIRYLLSLGAPLAEPGSDQPVNLRATMGYWSFYGNRLRTGTLFFDECIRQNVPIDYESIADRPPYINELAFTPEYVRVLYRAMKDGAAFFEGQPATAEYLHGTLLAAVLRRGRPGGAEFLIEKGVGGPEHVFMAVVLRNKSAFTAFMDNGHSVNNPLKLSPSSPAELPLEVALRIANEDFGMVDFLVGLGADPTLLPAAARQTFDQEYLRKPKSQ
ncbi:hypothetical protein GGR50DRAFT_418953 [Xylaria sp. CBS 124048]|nr:hypothetical protein GGR50DRAFT_418953 [Xylaria sp. CBS 124048]